MKHMLTLTVLKKLWQAQGRCQNLTEQFSKFKEHYGFKTVFMNPNECHEKGNIKTKSITSEDIICFRFLKVNYLMIYIDELLDRLDDNQKRSHYYKQTSIPDLFEDDKVALMPLPSKTSSARHQSSY